MKLVNNVLALSVFSAAIFSNANAVNVHHFYPVMNNSYIQTEDTMSYYLWGSRGDEKLFLSANYDYINDPLVALDSKESTRIAKLSDSMNSLSLGVAYNFYRNFELGFNTGVSLAKTRIAVDEAKQKFGLNDSKILAKIRLTNQDSKLGVAIIPFIEIPTGKEDAYLKNKNLGFGAKLALEYDVDVARFAANIGYRHSKDAVFQNLDISKAIPMSIASLIPVSEKWAINLEAAGLLFSPVSSNQNDGAFWGGARYKISNKLAVSGALGLGSLNDYSSANIRFYAGLTYFENEYAKKEEPKKEEIKPIVITNVITKKGKDGKDGVDGVNSCVMFNDPVITATGYTIQQLDKMIKNGIEKELPYYFGKSPEEKVLVKGKKSKIKKNENIATLDLLSLGRTTKGLQYVKDAEVLFEFNFRLPNRKILLTNRKALPVKAKLNLEIVKKKMDKGLLYNDTESVCLINTKNCSGSFFHESGFTKLINSKYTMLNDVFSGELKKGIEAAETSKNNSVWVTNVELDLAEIFSKDGKKLSEEELLNVLYSGNLDSDESAEMLNQKLKFVVSDDTMVQRAFLSISYAYDGCAITKLEMPEHYENKENKK